jgi:hypothetical protein
MGLIVILTCYSQMTVRTAIERPLKIEERALDRELRVAED